MWGGTRLGWTETVPGGGIWEGVFLKIQFWRVLENGNFKK